MNISVWTEQQCQMAMVSVDNTSLQVDSTKVGYLRVSSCSGLFYIRQMKWVNCCNDCIIVHVTSIIIIIIIIISSSSSSNIIIIIINIIINITTMINIIDININVNINSQCNKIY